MKSGDEIKNENASQPWSRVFVVFVLVLPLVLLFAVPPHGSFSQIAFWLFVILLVNGLIIWMLLRGRARAAAAGPTPPRFLPEQETPPIIQQVMNVQSAIEDGGVEIFRGPLRESAESAFEKLKQTFAHAFVPLVQEDKRMGAAIFLVPKPVEAATMEKPVRLWRHWLLFFLTFLTTTWAGALHQGINLWQEPEKFAVGLPYSIGLLGILGFHELGHYFTARRYHMHVTPPFFIPVPFALGTFGAFIQMRSPAENRRSLFDVAIAGPLAGLVLAIPALIFGLRASTLIPIGPETPEPFLDGGNITPSILFALIAKISLGSRWAGDYVLRLSPLAFAGWLGLLVTALNLLPIGQLDGGHIARAMCGDRAGSFIGRVAMWALFLLAIFVWPNLLMWAVIVFFLARRATPPLNDLTPIDKGRRWLGLFSFLILLLILIPMPRG